MPTPAIVSLRAMSSCSSPTLVRSRRPEGRIYDYQQLQRAVGQRSALPTAELCSGLIDEIQQFSACKEFNDDVCLVAMEVGHLPMGSK